MAAKNKKDKTKYQPRLNLGQPVASVKKTARKKNYTRAEVWAIGKNIPPVPEDLPEPQLSETALYIGKTRYAMRNDKSEPIESAREMFWRVAYNIACADLLYHGDRAKMIEQAKKFYNLMASQKFIPNTPTMLNAAKPMQQLSACFVLPIEDDMRSIGKTLVDMVMIHKSGGGCIAADARVWTTFCGIEPIKTLFARATADGRYGIKQEAGIAYDVSDLDIRTVSMNPVTGETGLKKVTRVWKYKVPAEKQIIITTAQGTIVQTSSWHPFMVIRGTEIVEVPAEQLQKGDIVLGPDQGDKYWPWKRQKKVGSLQLSSDLAWLVGFTLGDGSFGFVPALRQYRVRWFSGTADVLKKVQQVLAKLNIQVSIQKDKRGLLSLSTLNQRFVHDLLGACGLEKFGPKDDHIRVPEIISKSPLEVIKAFVAGLLDSDGYVAVDGSPSYSTVSGEMAEDLAALVSLLGFSPTLTSKKPRGRGKLKIYSVQLCPLPQVNRLAAEIGQFLANRKRRQRLTSSSKKQTALPVDFHLWRDKLASLGMIKRPNSKIGGPGPLAGELNIWSSHHRIRRDHILQLAKKIAVLDKELSELLRRIATSGQEIKKIEKATIPKSYYDLSVEDWNTYAAGNSGMLMIHNTGFSFSRLRPYGDVIRSSGGTTVGPTSFLQAYNDVTSQIKQGGVRRGANMGIMHITHPDILRFAVMKVDEFNLTNFNISVTVTEDWMDQVGKDQRFVKGEPDWEEIIGEIKSAQGIRDVDLKLKKTEDGVRKLYDLVKATQADEGYDLINPRSKQTVGKLNAYKVFLLITQLAWHYGDPGMIMIDRINKSAANPTPHLGQIESTNPCGEQPLLPYDACTLGSINVGKFVTDGQIDYKALSEVSQEAVHFLDNVLDMNTYPIAEIAEMTKKIRRIGLGVMGLADLLVQMETGYNTDEGLSLAEDVMAHVQESAKESSIKLAQVRGVFPAWEGSIFDDKSPHFLGEKLMIRNGAVTTIAPTGTIAMLADASSGIEPYFALSYAKNTIEGKRLFNTNPFFLEIAKKEGFYSEELLDKIEQNGGSVDSLAEVPERWQKVFVVTRDITPEWHIKMQASFQKHVDNAISKTINFPNNATVEDVRRAYMMVYETGCKGITIYRDGSRQKQILEVKKEGSYYDQLAGQSTTNVVSKNGHDKTITVDGDMTVYQQMAKPLKAPGEAWGMRLKKKSDVGNVYTAVYRDPDGKPVEVFINVGKSGGYVAGAAEVTGRLASLALKHGAALEEVAAELVGIACGIPYGVGPNAILSMFDAAGKSILEAAKTKQLPLAIDNGEFEVNQHNGHTKDDQPRLNRSQQESLLAAPEQVSIGYKTLFASCPDCGSQLMLIEGCQKCSNPGCGYSKC